MLLCKMTQKFIEHLSWFRNFDYVIHLQFDYTLMK